MYHLLLRTKNVCLKCIFWLVVSHIYVSFMCQEVFHFCILHWELVGRLHLCCTPYNEPCGYNWTDPFFTCDFGAGSLCTPNMSSSLLLAATFTVCFIVLISCSCFSFAFSCSCFIWLALCICSSMSWSTEAQFEHLTKSTRHPNFIPRLLNSLLAIIRKIVQNGHQCLDQNEYSIWYGKTVSMGIICIQIERHIPDDVSHVTVMWYGVSTVAYQFSNFSIIPLNASIFISRPMKHSTSSCEKIDQCVTQCNTQHNTMLTKSYLGILLVKFRLN